MNFSQNLLLRHISYNFITRISQFSFCNFLHSFTHLKEWCHEEDVLWYVQIAKVSGYTEIFFSTIFTKGNNFWLPPGFPGCPCPSKMVANLKGKNLLQWEQIHSFKIWSPTHWEPKIKMMELLPLKTQSIILKFRSVLALNQPDISFCSLPTNSKKW